MAIDIPKDARTQAISSIERYFRENMDEPIGNMAAGALLGFFLEELGPLVYNKAVADVQDRLAGPRNGSGRGSARARVHLLAQVRPQTLGWHTPPKKTTQGPVV